MRNSKSSLDGNEKKTFLDVATSFIGMDKDDAIQILNYFRHFPKNGITVLEEKSLVTIDSKNRIGMHSLIREMGREIIRQQSMMGMAEAEAEVEAKAEVSEVCPL